MSAVRIAELEKRLSHHLRAVQQGDRVTVLDHGQPIATIVPYEDDRGLRVRDPAPGAPALADVWMPPALELDAGFDIVDLLEKERQSSR